MKNQTNGYTLLKMICAAQVFYGHVVMHFHLHEPRISNVLIVQKLLLPFQGVPIFFALSGYFIWQSLERKDVTFNKYVKRRFLRIFPELWLVVLLSVILIVAFEGNNLQIPQFVAWIFTQSTVMQFWTPDCLRGYGVGTPNGALWTITVFIQFYILIYLVHKYLRGKNILNWGGVIAISLLLNVAPAYFENCLPAVAYKLYQQSIFPYFCIFCFGAFISEYQRYIEKILTSKLLPAILYLVLLVGIPIDISGSGYDVIRSLLQVVFAISFGKVIKTHIIRYDISYEIYLVHMIWVNLFVELGIKTDWVCFFVVLIISIFSAFILYIVNDKIVKRLE